MIKKLIAIASIAVVSGAGWLVLPTSATAKSPAADYAAAQCGNGGYAQKEYPSYEECYTFAIQYYYQQTGSGPGGGGGGGGTWIPDIPGWTPSSGWGCGATHLPCNSGN
ncbi:hypothetical protein D3C73_288340 [compost metagenome]